MNRSASGIILATCILAGAVGGIFMGQASAGILAGLAVGVVAAIVAALVSGAGGRPR